MAPEFIPASVKPVAPAQPATLRRAYLTFLAGKGDSVKGLVGLAKGLRKLKSKYPLVVAVMPEAPAEHRRILKDQGCVVREIEPVYAPESQTQFSMGDYVIKYSKLRIWEFVEYGKMVYLDSGMQVYANIDDLFDMEDGYFYAAMDCFCEKTWNHTAQYEIGYCQLFPDKVQWRDDMGPCPAPYFHDGMFVFEPNRATCEDLLNALNTTLPTPIVQDFLNVFFRNIYRPLPLEYNLDISMLSSHPEIVKLKKAKAVLFGAAGSKP